MKDMPRVGRRKGTLEQEKRSDTRYSYLEGRTSDIRVTGEFSSGNISEAQIKIRNWNMKGRTGGSQLY